MSHQGQHDEFLFLFRDDDDDGVVESRAMIFHSEEAPPLWLLIVVFPPRALARGRGRVSFLRMAVGRRFCV